MGIGSSEFRVQDSFQVFGVEIDNLAILGNHQVGVVFYGFLY